MQDTCPLCSVETCFALMWRFEFQMSIRCSLSMNLWQRKCQQKEVTSLKTNLPFLKISHIPWDISFSKAICLISMDLSFFYGSFPFLADISRPVGCNYVKCRWVWNAKTQSMQSMVPDWLGNMLNRQVRWKYEYLIGVRYIVHWYYLRSIESMQSMKIDRSGNMLKWHMRRWLADCIYAVH